jgi:SAM-dependent methyltransferase
MHKTQLEKIRHFRDVHLAGLDGPVRVLDVGSYDVSGVSFRYYFNEPPFKYVGLDIEPGPNVDVVVTDPYKWTEIETESFDAVVSGSAFEHNPYFWVTMAEVARVLKPGAPCCIVAPSRGLVHRYPLDCWRFYPDAGPALAAYAGLEILESYKEEPRWRKITFGQRWLDWMMVARKPRFESSGDAEMFYRRLAAIVETRTSFPATASEGPVITSYESAQDVSLYRRIRFYGHLVKNGGKSPYM